MVLPLAAPIALNVMKGMLANPQGSSNALEQLEQAANAAGGVLGAAGGAAADMAGGIVGAAGETVANAASTVMPE